MMQPFLPVSEQVQILFDVKVNSEGRPYTLQEVSKATGIGLTTVGQVRNGRIKNPQLDTVRALCLFFDVPLAYFATKSAEECYAVLTHEKSSELPPEMNEVFFRAAYLSKEAQQDILKVIKWARAAEEAGQVEDFPPLPPLSGDEKADAE
jgi:transcriptional regulator with XRE-family HTH domain